MYCIRIVVFILLLNESIALFGDSLKKLRHKASEIYNAKDTHKSLNLMGHAASDYPGTNPKYLKINEELWEKYYLCLKAQQDYIGNDLSISPEAILGFEGGNVKLECKICISPKEMEQMELVVWQWATIGYGQHLEPVEFHENIILSPEEKTLHIYNLDSTHSGQYVCTLGEAATAPYFLTVITLNDGTLDAVHNPRAPLGPYPKEPEFLPKYNLVLDTEWTDWSTCSSCGNIGKKHKLGYCSIYSKEKKSIALEETTSKLNTNANDNNAFEVNNPDIELFNAFKFGIPCNSHIVPKVIQELPAVRLRNNEIMMGYCKIECATNEVFLVKDKNGNVIEKANNSEGIYSMLQPLPPLEPPVARKMVYGVKGKTIIMNCPGSMNTDAPILWQIGSKKLIPEIISAESNGRIFITITDRIHITKAKISYSNIYSCWQRDELAGTIRLIVEKKIEFNFNHTAMLIGIIIIMIVFLKIFVKAVIGRKYAKV